MSTTSLRLADLPRDLRPLASEGLRIAGEVGRLLQRRFRTGVAVKVKGPSDIVTEVDVEAQALVVRRLRRRFPDHGILAEEGLDTTAGTRWRWILDPLDGTKNFAHGLPSFCVSIAAERDGQVELGIVNDPVNGELFVGVRDHGAWCNGRPIRVSRVRELAAAFLGTGMPHRIRRFSGPIGRTFSRLAVASLGVRDRGAGAIDLCYVACGRFDGYWEIDQSPWDIAAGGLIVTEAGGRMSNFRGGPFDIYGGETVASNGAIHEAILRVLALPGGIPARYRPPVRRR
jgi:myo-inositol-1(or 4)-monophosphatase